MCFCQDKNAANINEKVQCPAEPQPSKEPKRKGEQAIQEDTPVSRCAIRFSEPEAAQVHPAAGQQHLLFLSDSSQQFPILLRDSPKKGDGKTSNNE